MNMVIGLIAGVVLGVLAPYLCRRCLSLLQRFSGSKASRGWVWVIIGGRVEEIRWRYDCWQRGKKLCKGCGVPVNANTQVGVSLTGEGAWCPKCTREMLMQISREGMQDDDPVSKTQT